MLKELAIEIAPALTLIFNASLQQGVIRHDWKEGINVLVFKKGCHSDPGYYSLQASVSYIYVYVVNLEYIIRKFSLVFTFILMLMGYCVMNSMGSTSGKTAPVNPS